MTVRLWMSLVVLMCAGCAPGIGALQSRQAAVRTLEKDITNQKAALSAVQRYERALKTGKGRWLALSDDEILSAMRQYSPYRFKGSTLSKKRLKGDLWLSKPSQVKFHLGNRLTYRTQLGAKNVSVNLKGVFGASKSDARKIGKYRGWLC